MILGRPTFLFPSGCHSIATMQSSFLSFLSTWPIQFHLLLRISSLIFFMPVTWEIVSFRMHCGHQILRILLRHVNWNLSSFFSPAAVSFHASHPRYLNNWFILLRVSSDCRGILQGVLQMRIYLNIVETVQIILRVILMDLRIGNKLNIYARLCWVSVAYAWHNSVVTYAWQMLYFWGPQI